MLTRMQAEEFDAVFEIMEQSFPTDERRPYAEQKALLQDGRYTVWVAKLQGQVAAFLAVWDLGSILFIEHFAVAEKHRNAGLGKTMLCELIASSKLPLCLEVEPPDSELTKRRVGFYRRCGFLLNPYPYLQPPISKGKRVVPLMIMSSDAELTEEQFQSIKTVLYREVYKIQNETVMEENNI